MMKTLSISLMALMVGTLYCSTSTANISFGEVDLKPQKTVSVKTQANPGQSVQLALNIHNLMARLADYRKSQTRLLSAQQEYELKQLRYKSLVLCNIKNLEPYFKNPTDALSKVLNKYDQDEKKLSIQINTTLPDIDVAAAGVANLPKSTADVERSVVLNSDVDLSDLDMSEMMLMWSLGNGVLHDLYANQDNWGERIDRSFPLTPDQQYLYDKAWYDKYKKLNQSACCQNDCGVGYKGAPDTREDGYDYHADYKYHEDGKVEKAHKDYVQALTTVVPASKECKVRFNPASASLPDMPPRPLPPVNETIFMDISGAQTYSAKNPPFSEQRIFENNRLNFTDSAWVAPWKTFIDSNFKLYNEKGDMPTYFKHKSLRTVSASEMTDAELEEFNEMMNNRFNVYQSLKKELDDADAALDAAKTSYIQTMSDFAESVENVNAQIQTMNITDGSQIPTLALPNEFALLKNFDLEQAETDEAYDEILDKVQVKNNRIMYQPNPKAQLKKWPEAFNGQDVSTGDLIVSADDAGVGHVYLKTVSGGAQQGFELMSDAQVKQITDNFNKAKNTTIEKARGEVAELTAAMENATPEEKERLREMNAKLTAEGDMSSSENQEKLKKMSEGLAESDDVSQKEIKGFIDNAFTTRETSETSQWPDAMQDSSLENMELVLDALTEDKDAQVYFTKTNARRVSDLEKEKESIRELEKTWEKESQNMDKTVKKLDERCLNKGILK